jgi:hypothetical protein
VASTSTTLSSTLHSRRLYLVPFNVEVHQAKPVMQVRCLRTPLLPHPHAVDRVRMCAVTHPVVKHN